MSTITHEQTGAVVTVEMTLHPWRGTTQHTPVVHTPLDGSPPWVSITPTPPERLTIELLDDAPDPTSLLAILATPGTVLLADPALPAPVRVVVETVTVTQALPVWAVTVAAIRAGGAS